MRISRLDPSRSACTEQPCSCCRCRSRKPFRVVTEAQNTNQPRPQRGVRQTPLVGAAWQYDPPVEPASCGCSGEVHVGARRTDGALREPKPPERIRGDWPVIRSSLTLGGSRDSPPSEPRMEIRGRPVKGQTELRSAAPQLPDSSILRCSRDSPPSEPRMEIRGRPRLGVRHSWAAQARA